ncbi:MAG TPA: helix-turn-helix domain-containing protein [Solirubrobacteraceae bacterium]|jgi:excisionase family DNA binding protein|nr:helix-turn-helix domain-containing protein [Solirubrobacteraceae bacterium]
MHTLTMIPARHAGRTRRSATHPAPPTRGAHEPARGFTPLIDAKAAGELLGVPHTWLLAQARAGRIPHHRLGHYVRFNAHDLDRWLKDTRRGPSAGPGIGRG